MSDLHDTHVKATGKCVSSKPPTILSDFAVRRANLTFVPPSRTGTAVAPPDPAKRQDFGHRLGAVIARARKDARLRGDELAEAVGVSRATLSTWEMGRVVPDAFYLARVVQILDISFDEVVLGREAVEARLAATPPAGDGAAESPLPAQVGDRTLRELISRMIDEQQRLANEVDRLKRDLRESGALPAHAGQTSLATGTA